MTKKAYLAGGCFWGLEELVRQQPGVVDTEVGYTGGTNNNPTYQNHPGHAEALCISYDDTKTSYKHILDFYFRVHDPTTLDRQGNDVGAAYRSAIFYQDYAELADAKDMISLVNNSGNWPNPVVTTLEPFTKFWPAEDYHQDYLQQNPGGYTCHYVRQFGSYLEPKK
ncbi:peptide-methionine (S)-S-oxide reductase [bacterium]|nr:peptide-methionine (S)-S-oxide reductase [bacterium]NDC94282.1 peptide-methionine (S)-S-oxide reductase [bacterium]NDD84391.1 peptide-methionine (S)-S-oxide reductase [bacterium]NDG31254.1 peptide-methionine (S)-S-oxide reductase [bacterium]